MKLLVLFGCVYKILEYRRSVLFIRIVSLEVLDETVGHILRN